MPAKTHILTHPPTHTPTHTHTPPHTHAHTHTHKQKNSVGVGKLPNKAAVGLACRLHDRTIACVTAHFAADKHGKERPEARVRDAVRSLRELSLGGECEEVDLPYAVHHTIGACLGHCFLSLSLSHTHTHTYTHTCINLT